MIAPNGIATRQAGKIDTLATNQHCCRNSRHWNGRRNTARPVSSDIATKLPVSRNSAAGLVTRWPLQADDAAAWGQTGRCGSVLQATCPAQRSHNRGALLRPGGQPVREAPDESLES